MAEIDLRQSKRILGIILLIVLLILSFIVYQANSKLGVFLIIGLALGFIESHSEIGLASGYVDFFLTGSRTRLYSFLLLFALGSLGALIVHATAALNGALPEYLATSTQTIIPGTSAVTEVNFGLILGSFLFGVGLTLNKGCGVGTLRNTGLGQIRFILTFLFIMIGAIPGQWVKYRLDQSVIHNFSLQVYFPNIIGYQGTLILGLIVFTLLALWGVYVDRRRKKGSLTKATSKHSSGEMKTKENNHPVLFYLLQKKWPRIISVILITILLLVALTLTGEKLAVTYSFIYPAVALFQRFGFTFNDPAFSEALEVVNNGLLNNHVVVQNIGIVFGALLFGLLSMDFRISWGGKLKEVGLYIFSGLLMGFGVILASGCIVGALYSGIVNFSLSGWIVFLSMSMGIWLTVKMMNGVVSTIPAIEK